MLKRPTRAEYIQPILNITKPHVTLTVDFDWQLPDVPFKMILDEARRLAADKCCSIYVVIRSHARNKAGAASMISEALRDINIVASIAVGSKADDDEEDEDSCDETYITDELVAIDTMKRMPNVNTVEVEWLSRSPGSIYGWPRVAEVPEECVDIFLLQEWLMEQGL